MDNQIIFDIAIATAGALGGWVLNSLRESINALHQQDAALTDKVQAIEVLVAGEYVKRDDLDKLSSAIFTKLDRIENKIDGKADK